MLFLVSMFSKRFLPILNDLWPIIMDYVHISSYLIMIELLLAVVVAVFTDHDFWTCS